MKLFRKYIRYLSVKQGYRLQLAFELQHFYNLAPAIRGSIGEDTPHKFRWCSYGNLKTISEPGISLAPGYLHYGLKYSS